MEPLTSLPALAVVFELNDILEELLKRENAKACVSSPLLLYQTVSQF